MANTSDFQTRRGTVLASFTQTGTYSNTVDMSGGRLVGLYSDNWPSAAGSIVFRNSWNASGTGYPLQTNDGTVLKVLAFGSGTAYTFNTAPHHTNPLHYVTLQIGTGGTAAVAAGGTIVLITEA